MSSSSLAAWWGPATARLSSSADDESRRFKVPINVNAPVAPRLPPNTSGPRRFPGATSVNVSEGYPASKARRREAGRVGG
jgi:hypothetical protein